MIAVVFPKFETIRLSFRRTIVEYIPYFPKEHNSWFYEIAVFVDGKEKDPEKRFMTNYDNILNDMNCHLGYPEKLDMNLTISLPSTNEILFKHLKTKKKKS